jgi:enoyl-CoA hydratase/carnithine racemase
MIFTARLIEADEAKSIGLVSEVVKDATALAARANELACLITGHAPLTLPATKAALRRLRIGETGEEDLIRLCYMSRDFREGMDAFLTKRLPIWSGE